VGEQGSAALGDATLPHRSVSVLKGVAAAMRAGARREARGRWALGTAAVAALLALGAAPSPVVGQMLRIDQIQYTTAGDGGSPYAGQVVNCDGGVVVGKFAGTRPRLVLQDPGYPHGWGAIQVKDWVYPYQMYTDAQIGDWVKLYNMMVEEFRGTTLLQRQSVYNPSYTIVSHGNPTPPPKLVAVSTVPAPVYDPVRDGWFVADHAVEYLESMRVTVRDVSVVAIDLGKAYDNYELTDPLEHRCWVSDYMNVDATGVYHPFVAMGRHFCAVTGVFEQYTNLSEDWDYYQIITQSSVDLALCGDGDVDGDRDVDDWARFVECVTGPMCEGEAGCDPPAWTLPPWNRGLQDCLMMDRDADGDVDLRDAAGYQRGFGF